MVDVPGIVKGLVCVAGVAVIYFKHREIADAIERFKNNFPRGGPKPPMHPSIAGDDAHLRPGSRKNASN